MKTLALATTACALSLGSVAAADFASTQWKLTDGDGAQRDLIFTSQIPDGQNYRLTGYIGCYWQGASGCGPQGVTGSLSADGRIAITVPLPGPDDRAWPWLAYYDGQITGNGTQITNGTVWYYGGAVGRWSAFSVPHLSISRLSDAQAQVTWPTNFAGYRLEHAASLPAARWTSTTNDMAVTEGRFSVIVDASGLERFFQLRKP